MIKDFLHIIVAGLQLLSQIQLFKVIVAAFILSALFWIINSYYTRLWNKSFQVSPKHHLICGASALLTFFFVLSFAGIRHLRPVSERTVRNWSSQLKEDQLWNDQIFSKAYYAVKKTGRENFENIPPPGSEGSIIPFSAEASLILSAEIYADEACRDFSKKHRFLTILLSAKPTISNALIKKDMDDYFKTEGNIYPLERAVQLASNQIMTELLVKTPRVVRVARAILVLIFILVQIIPFGIIGYFAYKDLKIYHH